MTDKEKEAFNVLRDMVSLLDGLVKGDLLTIPADHALPAISAADVRQDPEAAAQAAEAALRAVAPQEGRPMAVPAVQYTREGKVRQRHYTRKRCPRCRKLVSSNAFGQASHRKVHEREDRAMRARARKGTVLVKGDALSAGH